MSIEGSVSLFFVETDIHGIHEIDTLTIPGSLFGPCVTSNFRESYWLAYVPLLVGELGMPLRHHHKEFAHNQLFMLVMLSLILAKVHLATRMDSGLIYSKTLLQIVKDGTCSPADINGRNYQQRIRVPGAIYFVLISCEFIWYLGFSSHRWRAVGLTIANILFVRFARVR